MSPLMGLLLVAGLFVCGVGFNVYYGTYDVAGQCGVIAILLFGLYLFWRRQERQNEEFLTCLLQNKEEMKRDRTKPIFWNDVSLTYDSQVVQYQSCMSFIVITYENPTAYIPESSPQRIGINLLATVITLLIGWWGFPWGPVYSVRSLYRNARGGVKTPVSELIAALDHQQ